MRQPFSSETRAVDGFILQAVGPGGERRWFVRRGYGDTGAIEERPTFALRAVCDELDALPGEWKVETISTPATIYRDLQGTRAEMVVNKTRRVAAMGTVGESVMTPERQMLGHIGRSDLLAS